jgi:hypothetical protein
LLEAIGFVVFRVLWNFGTLEQSGLTQVIEEPMFKISGMVWLLLPIVTVA